MAETLEQVVKVLSIARFKRVLPIPDQVSERDIDVGNLAVVSLHKEKTAISITYTFKKVK